MSKKLLFAIIAIICTTTAFADSKTITTQDYVDTNFQTKIPATSSDYEWVTKTLVATTDTAGQVEQIGFLDNSDLHNEAIYNSTDLADMFDYDEFVINDSMIPSKAQVDIERIRLQNNIELYKQSKIPKSGFVTSGNHNYNIGASNWTSGMWLYNDVKGTGLVTKTATDGIVGERKIIETADVANYGTGTATQQQVQEISIPTMGAVMAAISANAPTLPTGTAGNVVTYNAQGNIGGSVATYNGSTTYNASTDASKIAVMSAVQRKMTCARYIANAAQTAENCLLWNVPD